MDTKPILSTTITAFADLNLGSTGVLPTPDQCIAHLKLLEAISKLRQRIGATDGLYGLTDALAGGRPVTLAKIREKRWAIYVNVAARRFERWFEKLPGATPKCTIRHMQMAEYPNIHIAKPLQFTRDSLPPLDVVMVWHSFCLNPRKYLSDCIRHGRLALWNAGMPWDAIAASIDDKDFSFNPSETAQAAFNAATDLPWSTLDEPPNVNLKCLTCNRLIACPLTSLTSPTDWSEGSDGVSEGFGSTDPKFRVQCPCGEYIDHGVTRAHRFRTDLQLLLSDRVPMPGTLLSIDGLTTTFTIGTKDQSTYRIGFINRVLEAGAGQEMLARAATVRSMDGVRTDIERYISSRLWIKKASLNGRGHKIDRTERIGVRRMMSAYWDNASSFSIDLVGAVIRQNVFVEKMHDLGWLHSPNVRATATALVTKYERFFKLMRDHPNNTAVPTLDVDLAWHTHQLSPPSYRDYSVAQTKIFIDHDDKIDETRLSRAFEWTSKTYEKTFGEVYSECMCWYCESVRAAHTSKSEAFFGRSGSIEQDLDRVRKTAPTDPLRGPHLSAHNAVHPQRSLREEKVLVATVTRQLEANYAKAVRRAKREGRPIPVRDTKTYPAWGMAYPVPMYVPYMGDPCINGSLYATDPGCANFTPGGSGNCCAGSCGGVVAMGGCGNAAACGGIGGFGNCGGGGIGGGGCGGGGGGCGGGGGGGGGGCGGGGGGGGC